MSRVLFLIISLFAVNISNAQLISYNKVESFSAEQLEAKWKAGSIPKIIAPVHHGVDVYDVMYYMKWHDGSMVKASGLYFVPQKVKEDMPLLVYNHGTAISPKRHIGYNGEEVICTIFATDGYAVLAPDYVGLGHGETIHLYIHSDSEADAGIYFMKAAEEINQELELSWNDQLFISGYSQGGHATLALHKKLQKEYSSTYKVTASSPMSGPYDVSVTQAKVMFQEYTQPHYLPYLLIGYNEAYSVWPDEEFYNVFAEPYDSIIPEHFASRSSVGDINAVLPVVPKNMMKEEFIRLYEEDENYFFKKILEENNVYDWKPEAPVQFCYCKGDEEVLYENALVAHAKMKENGAKHVRLKHVGKKYTHRGCADFAVIYSKYYFDSFRKGSKKGRKGPMFKRFIVSLGKMIR